MRHRCSCGWSLIANEDTRIKCGQCGKEYTLTDGRLIPLVYGLGDYVATLTRYTGLAWLTKKLTRGQCGCSMRQAKLNRWGSKLAAKIRALRF